MWSIRIRESVRIAFRGEPAIAPNGALRHRDPVFGPIGMAGRRAYRRAMYRVMRAARAAPPFAGEAADGSTPAAVYVLRIAGGRMIDRRGCDGGQVGGRLVVRGKRSRRRPAAGPRRPAAPCAGRGNWNVGMRFVGIGMVHGGGTTAVEYCGGGMVGVPVTGVGVVAAGLFETGGPM